MTKATEHLAGEIQLILQEYVIVHWIMMCDDPTTGITQFGQKTGVGYR